MHRCAVDARVGAHGPREHGVVALRGARGQLRVRGLQLRRGRLLSRALCTFLTLRSLGEPLDQLALERLRRRAHRSLVDPVVEHRLVQHSIVVRLRLRGTLQTLRSCFRGVARRAKVGWRRERVRPRGEAHADGSRNGEAPARAALCRRAHRRRRRRRRHHHHRPVDQGLLRRTGRDSGARYDRGRRRRSELASGSGSLALELPDPRGANAIERVVGAATVRRHRADPGRRPRHARVHIGADRGGNRRRVARLQRAVAARDVRVVHRRAGVVLEYRGSGRGAVAAGGVLGLRRVVVACHVGADRAVDRGVCREEPAGDLRRARDTERVEPRAIVRRQVARPRRAALRRVVVRVPRHPSQRRCGRVVVVFLLQRRRADRTGGSGLEAGRAHGHRRNVTESHPGTNEPRDRPCSPNAVLQAIQNSPHALPRFRLVLPLCCAVCFFRLEMHRLPEAPRLDNL